MDRYLTAFDDHDIAGAAELTDNPDAAQTGIEQVWKGLSAQGVSSSTGHARTTADNADIDVMYTWKLAGGQTWGVSGDSEDGEIDAGLDRALGADEHPPPRPGPQSATAAGPRPRRGRR